MSSEAVGYVYRHSPYGDKTFNVHHAIADIVNDVHDNLFWLPLGKLAKKARCSRPTTTAAMDQLVRDGFVELVEASKGGGAPGEGSSVYRFLFPEKPVIFESRFSAKSLNTENRAVLNPQRSSAKSTKPLGTRTSLLNPREPKGNFQSQKPEPYMRLPEWTPEYQAAIESLPVVEPAPIKEIPEVKAQASKAREAMKALQPVEAYSERKGKG
jgi:hypothetical protein